MSHPPPSPSDPSARLDQLAAAVRQSPRDPQLLIAWAAALKAANRLDDAANAAQRAIQAKPDLAPAHALLAEIHTAQFKLPRAIQSWEMALRFNPAHPDWWLNYADTLAKSGRPSLQPLQRALELAPNNSHILIALGRAHESLRQFPQAELCHRQAISHDPQNAAPYHRLGLTLLSLNRTDEATTALSRAAELQPANPTLWHDLATAHELNRQDLLAESAFRRALELRPADSMEWTSLGRVLRRLSRLDEARAAMDRALQLDPKNHLARAERTAFILLAGDLLRGFEEYEHRFDAPHFPGGKRPLKFPRWTGQHLQNKTIMLHAEQGLGDVIQFLRFIPLVAALHPAALMLEVPEPLLSLARSLPGVHQILASGTPWPVCDFQIPLMSLPHVFKTQESTIPRQVPYMQVPDALLHEWSARIGPANGRQKIGLAWAGGPLNPNDHSRSIPLALFAPLFSIPNIDWFSLQKGPAESRLAQFPNPLRNLMPAAKNLQDTAALIQNLDLILSVDTAVAHLAGALARPTWLLLPLIPDWRWMLKRSDSPWYPTLCLFRQTARNAWPDVIDRIKIELETRHRMQTAT